MKERFAIRLVLVATLLAVATVVGCGGSPHQNQFLSLEEFFVRGASDESVIYNHSTEQLVGGFDSPPYSLWRLDTTTGIASRLLAPTKGRVVIGNGDYYVLVENEDDSPLRNVVGVQISTGDRFAITEHDGPGIGLTLNGSILVVRIDSRIELFDLDTRVNTKTIDIPDGIEELVDVHGNLALGTRNDPSEGTVFFLVNLTDGTQTQLPPAPGDTPSIPVWLAESWVVFSRGGFLTEKPFELLTFHIPNQEWRVLASNDPPDATEVCWPGTASCFDAPSEDRFVAGLNETHAILFRYFGLYIDLLSSEIELVDLVSGERTLVAREFGYDESTLRLSFPRLENRRVYWIDNMTRTLMIYDIDAGTYRELPLPSVSEFE